MLQINTGKLFSRGVGYKNSLTGVLYTNASLPPRRDIKTKAGSLHEAYSRGDVRSLVYEMEERIEASPVGPGILVSHTAGPYLDDFAIVASFGLGAVFSQDPSVVRTLIDGKASFGNSYPPNAFVQRFFEPSVRLTDEDVDAFEQFVVELLALERKSFLGAMSAMRTFVGGLHRIPDNLAQAYTMMVSAVESLAQDFDGFVATWDDFNQRKRTAIDRALVGLDQVVIDAVREAVISNEHIAISRRYRDFIISHTSDSLFLAESMVNGRAISRYELKPAVENSYKFRSMHVHELRQLPTEISHPFGHWETTSVERLPALTFQGLHRVTSHVIRSFISRQPKVETESYDYGRERSGIVELPMAPQYWIWKPMQHSDEASGRLEALISLTVSLYRCNDGVGLPDMRPVLADVERLLPQAPQRNRLSMLTFHILSNLITASQQRSPGFDAFFSKHSAEAATESVENIVTTTLLDCTEDWSVADYSHWLDEYFTQRVSKKGLHAPRALEATMCLALADKLQRAGRLYPASASH